MLSDKWKYTGTIYLFFHTCLSLFCSYKRVCCLFFMAEEYSIVYVFVCVCDLALPNPLGSTEAPFSSCRLDKCRAYWLEVLT